MNNTNHISYRYIGDVSQAKGDGVIVLATSLDREKSTVSVGLALCRPETPAQFNVQGKPADRYDKRFMRSIALFRLRTLTATTPEQEQAAIEEFDLDLKTARTRVKKSQTSTRVSREDYLNARQQKVNASENNPAWLGYRKVESTYFTPEDFMHANTLTGFVCDIVDDATHKDIDEAILSYMLLEMRFPKWAQSLIANALDTVSDEEDASECGTYALDDGSVADLNDEFTGICIVHNTAREWWYLAKDPEAHPSEALTPLCESRKDLFVWLRGIITELESDDAIEVDESFTEDDFDEDDEAGHTTDFLPDDIDEDEDSDEDAR